VRGPSNVHGRRAFLRRVKPELQDAALDRGYDVLRRIASERDHVADAPSPRSARPAPRRPAHRIFVTRRNHAREFGQLWLLPEIEAERDIRNPVQMQLF